MQDGTQAHHAFHAISRPAYTSETTREESSLDIRCSAELLMNDDVKSLPTEDMCSFIVQGLTKPLKPPQNLSMSMQMYWLYCALAILNPTEAGRLRQGVISRLRSWVRNPTGLISSHDGYPAHALVTFGATLLMATTGAYELVDRDKIHAQLAKLFDKNMGCFCIDTRSQENDMRVSYTCVAVGYCYALLDNKAIFGDSLVDYFLRSQAYDGGFCSNATGGESHAAYTFCGLAGLYILLGRSSAALRERLGKRRVMSLLVYISSRQTKQGGFAGRHNKLVDGCYTYWVMGSLYLLAGDGQLEDYMVINADALYRYVLHCAYDRAAPYGERGLRDKPGTRSDAYHNIYVMSGYLILLRLVAMDENKARYSQELLTEIGKQKELIARHDPLFNTPAGSVDAMHQFYASKTNK